MFVPPSLPPNGDENNGTVAVCPARFHTKLTVFLIHLTFYYIEISTKKKYSFKVYFNYFTEKQKNLSFNDGTSVVFNDVCITAPHCNS